MKRYTIIYKEVLEETIEVMVDAENEAEAIEKAKRDEVIEGYHRVLDRDYNGQAGHEVIGEDEL